MGQNEEGVTGADGVGEATWRAGGWLRDADHLTDLQAVGVDAGVESDDRLDRGPKALGEGEQGVTSADGVGNAPHGACDWLRDAHDLADAKIIGVNARIDSKNGL